MLLLSWLVGKLDEVLLSSLNASSGLLLSIEVFRTGADELGMSSETSEIVVSPLSNSSRWLLEDLF